jgi:transcriptional regulator with XRE-family HTH domain
MIEPGQMLKRARERLNLRYRDVEEASRGIALRHGSEEYTIGLSRLADIENKATTPSLYRLYSLCAIYRLDFTEVLSWYGVALDGLLRDSSETQLDQTHLVGFEPSQEAAIPVPALLLENIDLNKNTFLSHVTQQWGEIPLAAIRQLDLKRYRYGFVGIEDWTMYPIIPPGAFVQIDEAKKSIVREGWAHEFERPIYFLEHRSRCYCSWCSVNGEEIILEPHPSSQVAPEIFRYPSEVDIIGQVVGVAKRMDLGKRRQTHS